MFGWKKTANMLAGSLKVATQERDEALAKVRDLENKNTLLKARVTGVGNEKAELSKHMNDAEYECWQLEGIVCDLEQQLADAITAAHAHANEALHVLYTHPSAQRMNQKAAKAFIDPLFKIVNMGRKEEAAQ